MSTTDIDTLKRSVLNKDWVKSKIAVMQGRLRRVTSYLENPYRVFADHEPDDVTSSLDSHDAEYEKYTKRAKVLRKIVLLGSILNEAIKPDEADKPIQIPMSLFDTLLQWVRQMQLYYMHARIQGYRFMLECRQSLENVRPLIEGDVFSLDALLFDAAASGGGSSTLSLRTVSASRSEVTGVTGVTGEAERCALRVTRF